MSFIKEHQREWLIFTKKNKHEWRFFSCEKCENVISFWKKIKPKDWNIKTNWQYSKFCSNCKMITKHQEILSPISER